jgi:hypothetical protein
MIDTSQMCTYPGDSVPTYIVRILVHDMVQHFLKTHILQPHTFMHDMILFVAE